MKNFVFYAVLVIFMMNSCSSLFEDNSFCPVEIEGELKTKSAESWEIDRTNQPFCFDEIVSGPKWKECKSLNERFLACQVPEEALSNMTTEALLMTCINHPLARLYFAYDNYLDAIDVFAEHCNAFQVFVKRPDAAKVISEVYRNLEVQPIAKGIDQTEQGYIVSMTNECFLELVMGSGYIGDIVQDSLLNEMAERRLYEKMQDKETYSQVSYKSTLLLKEICILQDTIITKEQARILYRALYSKQAANRLTKADIIGTVAVYTRFGKQIEGDIYEEITPAEYNNALIETYSFNPNAEVVDNPTHSYNCHSYAWNMSDGGTTCWIEPYTSLGGPNIEKYWTQDYYGTTSQSYADKAVYFGWGSFPVHSAVLYSSGTWESKWGYGPVVRHALYNVPYYYSTVSFYGQATHTIPLNIPAVTTVGIPIYCDLGWIGSIDHGGYVWLITDQHDNESGYTQNQNGANNTITFTQAGAYEIDCTIYWYSEVVGHAHEQIIVTN